MSERLFGPDPSTLDAIIEGPRVDPPPGAKLAKRCQCDEPWVERDVDGYAHCMRCGRDV